MKYSGYIKTIKILKAITAPIIFLYFIGFVGCFHFNLIMIELHRKASEEGRNNEWFAKKAVSMYFKTALFTFMNLFFWFFTIRFLIK